VRLIQPHEAADSPDDLADRAFTVLDRRLTAHAGAPVAVAVSGGGDSVALLALACDWAGARERPILALSVDHGLQAGSADWSRLAVETAQRLGAEARVLPWEGEKPATGLPAAARAARHRLLADAAREGGAGVILMAHTADDLAETEAMRADGSTLPDVREWSPSPAWPEGRGVFLLRPLLGERRQALRAFLRARRLEWIEDPANADPKYARSRARSQLQTLRHSGKRVGAGSAACPEPTWSALDAAEPRGEGGPGGFRIGGRTAPWSGMTELWEGSREEGGALVVGRAGLRAAPPATARRFLAAALLCAAGTSRPPRGGRLDALLARLRSPEPVAATLAGAEIQALPDEIFVTREMPRGGLAPLEIAPRGVSVWDGRFEIEAGHTPLRIVAAAGLMARLGLADRKEILELSPILRRSQPLNSPAAGTEGPARPVLASASAKVRPLARSRLRAALGLVQTEAEIASGRVAPEGRSSYVVAKRPPEAAAN